MRARHLGKLRTLLRASTESGLSALIAQESSLGVPLPLSRHIAVLSASGGVGCSTLAADVAGMLARLRGERVRLIDAQGASPVPAVPKGSSVERVSLPSEAWPGALEAWRELISAQPSRAELSVTDWGQVPLPSFQAIADASHAVCLVVSASRRGMDDAARVVAPLTELVPTAVCFVDAHGTATPATRRLVEQFPVPAVVIPYDRRRSFSTEETLPPDSRAAHELHRLCGDLVSMVVTPPAPAATGGHA